MSQYTPGGLSFRALTILVEHCENFRDWPIIRNDQPRNICTHMLIQRGLLRVKDSRTTTITRHGREVLHNALGRWADLHQRRELASDNVAVYNPADGQGRKTTEAEPTALAGECGRAVADREDQALPT